MANKQTNTKVVNTSAKQNIFPWLWLSIAATLLAIAGSIIGLSFGNIYAKLTPVFLPQAIAQDIANLAVASPAWLILAILALRGSSRATLMWLGVLTFTIYNYFIYTFSIPFGPLFPLWVAVLGLSLYALIGSVTSIHHKGVQSSFTSQRAVTVTAYVLMVTAILFAFLWLSEDVPALLSGKTPQSLIDMGLPTNPVHILDLSFFLPAVVISAIMLFRQRPLGFTLAPAFLVFLILTGIPILITPFVQSAAGEVAAWGAEVPIGTLTVILFCLLVWLLSTVHSPKRVS